MYMIFTFKYVHLTLLRIWKSCTNYITLSWSYAFWSRKIYTIPTIGYVKKKQNTKKGSENFRAQDYFTFLLRLEACFLSKSCIRVESKMCSSGSQFENLLGYPSHFIKYITFPLTIFFLRIFSTAKIWSFWEFILPCKQRSTQRGVSLYIGWIILEHWATIEDCEWYEHIC